MANSKENLARSFGMMEKSMEKMWDLWLVGLEASLGLKSKWRI